MILIIGDGMDEQQITIARNYLKGAAGQLLLDQMPLRAAAQILTTEERENGKPVYVADSANTATSMATGAITSTGRISTSAGSDKDLTTIVLYADFKGPKDDIRWQGINEPALHTMFDFLDAGPARRQRWLELQPV